MIEGSISIMVTYRSIVDGISNGMTFQLTEMVSTSETSIALTTTRH